MGTNSEGQVKYCVARFLDMPRRIAQERVPTASNVGSHDVTRARIYIDPLKKSEILR